MWVLRIALATGRLPSELEDALTARDLALYQALVEEDGPWWGEREAAYLRQVCSVQAAAAGLDVPPDSFKVEWAVGSAGDAPANLLPPADGLAIFAARHGLDVTEEAAP